MTLADSSDSHASWSDRESDTFVPPEVHQDSDSEEGDHARMRGFQAAFTSLDGVDL